MTPQRRKELLDHLLEGRRVAVFCATQVASQMEAVNLCQWINDCADAAQSTREHSFYGVELHEAYFDPAARVDPELWLFVRSRTRR